MKDKILELFNKPVDIKNNFLIISRKSKFNAQNQTNEIFTEKWLKNDTSKILEGLEEFQRKWYLELYGFENEQKLAFFLKKQEIILDAGCGLGYKAAWFANLSPESIVIGMDYSEAANKAAEYYKNIPNLFFIQGDIADTGFKNESIDYISCDQVIHHTEDVFFA